MKVSIFLLSFFIFSCKNVTLKKNISSEILIEKFERNENKKVFNNFQDFYSDFRNKLIKQEINELKNLAIFPLEVWGYEDDDPHLKINENEFEFYLKLSMNTSIDVDLLTNQSITTFDLIKRNEIVDSLIDYDERMNYQHIGQFYFSKIENNWKLTQIFADTKER